MESQKLNNELIDILRILSKHVSYTGHYTAQEIDTLYDVGVKLLTLVNLALHSKTLND